CLSFLFYIHSSLFFFSLFFFNHPPPTEIYTLSLHDALPISDANHIRMASACGRRIVEMVWEDLTPDQIVTLDAFHNATTVAMARSEEHTSELQSRENLVCRLLLEKKKKKKNNQADRELKAEE